MRSAGRQVAGISLIEVLVAISVIGVLIALLLPAVQDVRRAASRTDCQNRMRQLGMALHTFHDTHDRLPGAASVYADPSIYTRPGTGQELCWPTKVLPFIEQEPLWRATEAALRQTANPFQNPPHIGLGSAVKGFACPADPRVPGPQPGPGGRSYGLISYFGVSGTGEGVDLYRPPPRYVDTRGMFAEVGGVRFAQATDGLSNTLLLGERPPDPDFASGWWYVPNGQTPLPPQPVWSVTAGVVGELRCGPNGFDENRLYGTSAGVNVYGPGRFDNVCDAFHFWSPHGGGANWVVADGSVRFLPYAARTVLKELASRAGGEVVQLP